MVRVLPTIAIYAAGLLLTLGCLVVVPLPDNLGLRRGYTPMFEPPSGGYIYTNAWQFETGQAMLYHDVGAAIDHARTADVILMGNSRVQFGVHEDTLLKLSREAGLRVYSLASGHSETAGFGYEVLRRHDLRPKMVVVLGGPFIYSNNRSDVARQSENMTRWEAHKQVYGTAASWNLRYRLHRLVPRLDWFDYPITSPHVIYRSIHSGLWRPAVRLPGVHPVSYRANQQELFRPLAFAGWLQGELARRNILLVAGIVPYGDTEDEYLSVLREKLGIPVVDVRLDDLKTSDGSHLGEDSAIRFTQAFWRNLLNLKEVREWLSSRDGKS